MSRGLCLQMSIATDTKVLVVIMFDRAARVLFGCSADDFFHFAKTHPYACMFISISLHFCVCVHVNPKLHSFAMETNIEDFGVDFAGTTASKVLEGEMLTVTLSKPKNGNAQHLRVVSVVPMRTGFQPAIHTLRDLYPS